MAIHRLPSGILLAMDWLPSDLHQYKHFEPISNLPACFNVPSPLLPRSYSVPTPYLQRILNKASCLHQDAHLLATPTMKDVLQTIAELLMQRISYTKKEAY